MLRPRHPQAILDSIQLSLSNSITYVFFIGSLIVLSALVISALIRRSLKSAQEYHRPMNLMRPTKPKQNRRQVRRPQRSYRDRGNNSMGHFTFTLGDGIYHRVSDKAVCEVR